MEDHLRGSRCLRGFSALAFIGLWACDDEGHSRPDDDASKDAAGVMDQFVPDVGDRPDDGAVMDSLGMDSLGDAGLVECPVEVEVLLDGEPFCDAAVELTRQAAAVRPFPSWGVHVYAPCGDALIGVAMTLVEGLPESFPETVEPRGVSVLYRAAVGAQTLHGGRSADNGMDLYAPLEHAQLRFFSRDCIAGSVASLVAIDDNNPDTRRVEIRFSGEFVLP